MKNLETLQQTEDKKGHVEFQGTNYVKCLLTTTCTWCGTDSLEPPHVQDAGWPEVISFGK